MQAVDRTISVSDAQQDLEAIVLDVAATNHEVILEIGGEPKAVVIPVSLHRQLKEQRRQAFFDKLSDMARNANMDPEEAEKLAAEAVEWARRNKDT